MLGFFNYNKPAIAILRDLIYATNGFMLPPLGVIYDTPIAITPLVADRYQRDTVIKVEMDPSIPYQKWRGRCTFLYKRINLVNLLATFQTPVPISPASYPTNTYALLPQINAYYGLQLSENDVVNTTYASVAGPFVMTAMANSVAFEGNVSLNVTGYTQPPPPPPGDGTGSDGGSGSGSGSGSGNPGLGSDGEGYDGSGEGGTSAGGTGSDDDGSTGTGTGSGTDGTDGTSSDPGPDFEPNGESGVQDDAPVTVK